VALPEAAALASANKRVSNILEKQAGDSDTAPTVDDSLLEKGAERELMAAITAQEEKVVPLFRKGDYDAGLRSLADLQKTVDQFFDDVMVMSDDEALRNNRVGLLNRLRSLFLQVADISLLQTTKAA
jgi:glycyl-tRNA synthetase beta chain